jgi:hypothetical protein
MLKKARTALSLRMLTLAALSLLPLSARADGPTIITDPNAVVLDHTLAEWGAVALSWAFATPASALPTTNCMLGATCYNAFYDPTGEYAEAFNPGPIFIWTSPGMTPPSATACGTRPVRTVNVPHGVPILFPINSAWDIEGPNGISPPLIPPSITGFKGTYAEEVETVLNASSWTNVTMSVDCIPVANPQESIITEFSAGVVAQGSEGQVVFGPPGLPVGLELFPAGTAGYWAIIEGLTPGKHAISVSFSFTNMYLGCPTPTAPGCTSARTESINVVAPQ